MTKHMYRNRIGFHARSVEELFKVISIPLVDLVELKPEHLKKRSGVELYSFDGKKFIINHENTRKMRQLCANKGVEIQLHLPYEESYNSMVETGLCQADKSHHPMLLSRFEAMGELHDKYDIGTVVTMHPPAFRLNWNTESRDRTVEWTEEEALKAGIELYEQIDELITSKGYGFRLGVENIVAPKTAGASCVGYKPKQIDQLIGNTANIGITVDSGHRMLNDEMSISQLFSYGEVVNVHFHSNEGIIHDEDFKDDQHVLATPENLLHYNRFIKRFRRSALPIILEVGTKDYSEEELTAYVRNLRSEIERKEVL